jgi:hypothetical protein
MSLGYPEHLGCGGPLLPVAELEGLEDKGEPLFCARCYQHTAGARGDLMQATLAAAAEDLARGEASPRRRRRPGLVKTKPAERAEQLELFAAGRPRA